MTLLQFQDFLQEAADSFAGLRGLEAGIRMPGVFERLEDYLLWSNNAAIDFSEAFALNIGNKYRPGVRAADTAAGRFL